MLLIDADIIVYRIGFAAKDDPVAHALHSTDAFIFDILMAYPEVPYQLYLTGKDNFRNHRAVTAKYKGNRDKTSRPEHYQAIRDHIENVWNAEVVDYMEADDAIAMAATSHPGSIMASIDKDFNQVPGIHYNFVKRQEYTVTEEEGREFLYEQILTGDAADNIIGLRGIGPVKAKKLLAKCETEHEMYMACVRAYEEKDPSLYPVMRVCENANLLFLLRKEDVHWTVPIKETPQVAGV